MVLDPISALGLVSSILAVIDFSWELITGTVEIYHSTDGSTDENARLEDVTSDLRALTASLEQGHSPVKTQAERNLKRLAGDCREDAQTLLDLLESMNVSGSRRTLWKSLQAKWKSLREKDKVKELRQNLQESRSQILMNVSLLMQEDLKTYMDDIQESTKDLRMHMSNLREDTKDLGMDMARQVAEARSKLEQTVSDQIDRVQSSMLGDIVQQIKDMVSLSKKLPLQHRVLRQLIYEEMDARRHQIHDATPDTCRWILEEELDDSAEESSTGCSSKESDELSEESGSSTGSLSTYFGSESSSDTELELRTEIRRAFITWLRTGSGVMHISGKAGSGKSTLMKFIGRHGKTTEMLGVWAAPKRLILGQYYLWNAGTPAQRTLSGLYRSLLFQVLIQCPNLIEDVFRHQVNSMKYSDSVGDQFVERFEKFGDLRIEEAFELLLQKAPAQGHRLCFIIDGLDEFEGNRLRHEVLAIKLDQWTTSGEVKLLVSSRPWPEFHDVFTSNQSIHLHELNRPDIETFCLNQLKRDKSAELLEAGDRDALRFEVIASVVNNSEGIFLWAYLVLDNILIGLRNGDSVKDLKRKVDEFPPELDDLYDKLREPVEKSEIDKKRSNQILLLVLNAPKTLNISPFAISWLAGDDGPGLVDMAFPTDTELRPYSFEESVKRLRQAEKRINGLVRGLLEITSTGLLEDLITDPYIEDNLVFWRVTFCHKTTSDYLRRNERRYAALQAFWPDFSTSDVYGRICLAQILYGFRQRNLRARGYHVKSQILYFLIENWHYFTTETLNRIGDAVQLILSPYLIPWKIYKRLYGKSGVESARSNLEASHASFIHYASYFGFGRYVFTMVDTKQAQNAGAKSDCDGSILTSAWHGYNAGYCDGPTLLQFIDKMLPYGETVTYHPLETERGKENISLPSWMVVLSGLTRCYIQFSSDGKYRDDFRRSLSLDEIMRSFRILQQHGSTAEEEAIMIFDVIWKPSPSTDADDTLGPITRNITILSKQILQWAQDFATAVGDRSREGEFSSGKREALGSSMNLVSKIQSRHYKALECTVQSLQWKLKNSDKFEEIHAADSWYYRIW